MNTLFLRTAAVVLAFAVLPACSDDDDPVQPSDPTVHQGASAALGQGQVRVWEKAAADGSLLSVGVTFSEGVLEGLPQDMTALSLPLPQAVGTSPFTKVGFDWNPAGHEPDPIYTLPHFDLHFYVVTDQQLATVTPGPDMVPVPPANVPVDYVSGVQAVPFMGTHWVDTTSGEFRGQTFDETFIYGYYAGSLFFLEPMITKAYFESASEEVIDIKQPAEWQMSGKAFPRQYRISYDAQAKEYTVELISMRVQQ